MIRVGIDSGLSTTAVVAIDEKNKVVFEVEFGKGKDFVKLMHVSNYIRYAAYGTRLKAALEQLINEYGIHSILICIEHPFGLQQGNSVRVSELFGYYLRTLYELNLEPSQIKILGPTQVKKEFVGKGTAGKIDVILKCQELGYEPASNHLADGYAMAYILPILPSINTAV